MDEGSTNSLFLYSVETGEKHRLTSAPANSGGDWGPAVSPDGHTLAFSRWAGSSDLYLLDLSADFKPRGEPKRLGKTRKIRTMGRHVGVLTVSPDGRTILYTQLDETGSDLMLVDNFR